MMTLTFTLLTSSSGRQPSSSSSSQISFVVVDVIFVADACLVVGVAGDGCVGVGSMSH
jgi:hypothetical protein